MQCLSFCRPIENSHFFQLHSWDSRTRRGRCPPRPAVQTVWFLPGERPPAAPFLITQKWGKDVVKGGAFYKDAPPLTIPPSEAKNIS